MEALTAAELLVCLAPSSIVFVAVEVGKWTIRLGMTYGASVNGDAL